MKVLVHLHRVQTNSQYAGKPDEITVEQGNVYVHDGLTPGGFLLGGTANAAVKTYSFASPATPANGGTLAAGANMLTLTGTSSTVLPPVPVAGMTFTILATGVSAPNTVATVDFSGQRINGIPDTFVLDANYGCVTFAYVNASIGWIIASKGI